MLTSYGKYNTANIGPGKFLLHNGITLTNVD